MHYTHDLSSLLFHLAQPALLVISRFALFPHANNTLWLALGIRKPKWTSRVLGTEASYDTAPDTAEESDQRRCNYGEYD